MKDQKLLAAKRFLEPEHLIFCVDIDKGDVDTRYWRNYKNLIGKARWMTKAIGDGGWNISRRGGMQLYIASEESIDITDFLEDGKVSQRTLQTLRMIYPEHNWEKAFLKKDLVGEYTI